MKVGVYVQVNSATAQVSLYQGPHRLDDDIALALDVLNGLLSFSSKGYEQHYVISANGLAGNCQVVEALAVYLVGAISSCIAVNLEIREALFDKDNVNRELSEDVARVVGNDNNISDDKKRTERNPWVWEGIGHLIFHLSLYDNPSHPPDQVLAKTQPKLNVKDHGIDVIALYGSDQLGVSAGECKAYLQDPTRAIEDASSQLEEIDNKLRDAHIRIALSQFREVLSEEQKNLLIGTFWRNERAYFPMVCCDATASVDWTRKRPVLERLEPPVSRKFLVPLPIENASVFFDAVAEAMRLYASSGPEGS